MVKNRTFSLSISFSCFQSISSLPVIVTLTFTFKSFNCLWSLNSSFTLLLTMFIIYRHLRSRIVRPKWAGKYRTPRFGSENSRSCIQIVHIRPTISGIEYTRLSKIELRIFLSSSVSILTKTWTTWLVHIIITCQKRTEGRWKQE